MSLRAKRILIAILGTIFLASLLLVQWMEVIRKQEEAGLIANDWQVLGSFLSTPGFCNERIYLYLARNLTSTHTDHHQHEIIEVHWIEFRQALEWVHTGEIMDGKTMLGLLMSEREAM